MPRKYKPIPEYFLRTDPRYSNRVAMQFVNNLMRRGKKATALKVFYGALGHIKEKVAEKEPLEVLLQAVENVKPRLETKSRRVGGATYQVPIQVKPKRQVALAMKWILNIARKKKGRPMASRLADQILSAYRHEVGETAQT